MEGLGENDLHFAGAVGISVAGPGEDAIRAFMTDLARRYPFGRGVKAGPRPPATGLRIWARSQRNEAYAPVKELIARHFSECPIDPVDEGDGICRRPGERRIPLFDIRRQAKGPRVRARRLRPESVPFPSVPAMPAVMVPVRSRSAPSPASVAASLPCTVEAAARLGCDPVLFQSLQAYGLIVPVPDDRDWRHAFRPEDLDAFQARVLDVAPVTDGIPADAIGIIEAAEAVPCAAIEIVLLVLAGKIAWRGRIDAGGQLSALRVRACEVRSALDGAEVSGATYEELFAERAMPERLVDLIVEAGALRRVHAIDAITGRDVAVIDQVSLDEFAEKYVDIFEISDVWSSHIRDAKLRLGWMGLSPSFRTVDSKLEYYVEEDVENACTRMIWYSFREKRETRSRKK